MITALIAIALTTFRSAARSRLNGLLFLFCLALFVLTSIMTASSLNEDERLMKDLGLFLTSTFAILSTIGLSAQCLYLELERKSLFSLITKPIPRELLIWGKFFGIVLTSGSLIIIMSLAWSLLIWQMELTFEPIMFSAWFLIWIESVVICSVALLIGSFSSPFVTASLTFGFFLIGRFSDDIVSLYEKSLRLDEESFVLELAHQVLKIVPDLNAYNMSEEVLYDGVIPFDYILQTSLMGLSYTGVCLLIGAWLFKQRDLV